MPYYNDTPSIIEKLKSSQNFWSINNRDVKGFLIDSKKSKFKI